MASPAPPIADPQALVLLLTLIDDIFLEDIFLRLPTPDDVARVSAACPSFRCIITGRSFLRRFRAIHPPPLLGFVAYEGFHLAQPPHPSAPLARAFADAVDFSYSFVPVGRWLTPWHPRDVRQGRVLLECTPECDPAFEYYDIVLPRDLDLAVCDPLSRRYSLLPRIPKELRGQHKHLIDFGLFLAPTGEDEDETTFRVGLMCLLLGRQYGHTYDVGKEEWRMAMMGLHFVMDLSNLVLVKNLLSYVRMATCEARLVVEFSRFEH